MGRLDEVIIKLAELFKEYNTDGDKYLSSAETKAMLEKEINIDNLQGIITMENVKESLKQLDDSKEVDLRLFDLGKAVTQLTVIYNRKKMKQ